MSIMGNRSHENSVLSSERGLRKRVKKLPNKIMATKPINRAFHRHNNIKDVPQRGFSFSNEGLLATDNLQQCYALILHDPDTKQSGMAHIDYITSLSSIKEFIGEMQDRAKGHKLQVHVVGGEATLDCPISKSNEERIVEALEHNEDMEILSWDVRGKTHPTDIAFDTQEGTVHMLKDGFRNPPIHQRYREEGGRLHLTPEVQEAQTSGYPDEFIRRAYAGVEENISSADILLAKMKERWRCVKSFGKKKYVDNRALYHAIAKEYAKDREDMERV